MIRREVKEEIKSLQEFSEKLLKAPREERIKFLKQMGILDKNGNPSEKYYPKNGNS